MNMETNRIKINRKSKLDLYPYKRRMEKICGVGFHKILEFYTTDEIFDEMRADEDWDEYGNMFVASAYSIFREYQNLHNMIAFMKQMKKQDYNRYRFFLKTDGFWGEPLLKGQEDFKQFCIKMNRIKKIEKLRNKL